MRKVIVMLVLFAAVNVFAGVDAPKPYGVHTRDTISLSGNWNFMSDSNDVGVVEKWFERTLSDKIHLPGSTDENGVGSPEKPKSPYDALIRKAMYVGKAWYQKEVVIPDSWNEKRVTLLLERTHWTTQVWVDDIYIGSEESLCVANEYDLTDALTVGKHKITICVDNREKYFLGEFASSFSKHTQTSWNGIIGRIELNASDKVWIEDVQVYPNIAQKQAKVRLTVGNITGKNVSGGIVLKAVCGNSATPLHIVDFTGHDKQTQIETTISMGDDVKLWSEFSPALYQLKSQLKTTDGKYSDRADTTFGMREVTVKGGNIFVNGKKLFLRGTLECCVFPLTGYPAMTVEEWSDIFKTCKSYGLNHMRYHSWCPPDAAFAAADIEGVYLQAEAPRANIGNNKERDEFIEKEMFKINRYYGNHPSFLLLSSGNELHGAGSKTTLEMIRKIKQDDRRHLISTSSGGRGMRHERCNSPLDDFRVRGVRGIFGESTNQDHSSRIAGLDTPTISHEVGQWAIYPSPDEIKKYTGVLRPVNIEYIRDDLKAKGLLHLAPQFRKVSGQQSAMLYKEEIEVLLRTTDLSGFQLLDLHDYPGQGTAQVGILDAFWDSKGAITPEKFKRFCNRTVPLLRVPKRTYTTAEQFKASAEIIHFGEEDLNDIQAVWSITDDSGETVASGEFPIETIACGTRTELGLINVELSDLNVPSRLKVEIALKGREIANDWEIWCYPESVADEFPKNIIVTDSLTLQVVAALKRGATVLFFPASRNLKTYFPGRFKPSFWSPTWWWTKPRGGNVPMSILCDPKHPALSTFPTDRYTNWQWRDLLENSSSIILDDLPKDLTPIVRVVDNFSRNHRLGNIFEAKVGKGKMLLCSIDLQKDIEKRPVARQLRNSLLEYMQSDTFSPKCTLKMDTLRSLFKEPPILYSIGAKVIKTESQQDGYEGANIIDGDSETMWHTQWKPVSAPYPHEIVIEIPEKVTLKGLIYTPRQDHRNGLIKNYEIYLSNDDNGWGEPVQSGTFAESKEDTEILFKQPHTCRRIRFVALSSINNQPFAAIAELEAILVE